MRAPQFILLVGMILSFGLAFAHLRPQEEIGFKDIGLLVLGGVVGVMTKESLSGGGPNA